MMQILFVVSMILLLPVNALAKTGTRTVLDAEKQTVTVPLVPQRIIALSEIDLDSTLALGLQPIGTINGRGQTTHPHYLSSSAMGDRVNKIPLVGDLGRPNIEAIARLKPDLILTSPLRPEVLVLLRKIAPTVVTYQNGDHWKNVFHRVAEILNQKAKAEAFMAQYAKELQIAKSKLKPMKVKTVSIVRWNPRGPAFMYQDSFASLVLRDMGLERPKAQKIPGERHSMPLSLEALDTIDGDWLFVGTLDPRGSDAEALKEIKESPSFQRLSSVKNKHFFTVDGSKWTSIGGPLAALSIVKETSDLMTQSK